MKMIKKPTKNPVGKKHVLISDTGKRVKSRKPSINPAPPAPLPSPRPVKPGTGKGAKIVKTPKYGKPAPLPSPRPVKPGTGKGAKIVKTPMSRKR